MPTPLQSPIDIAAPITRDDLPPLDFRYPAAAIAVTAELVVQRGDPIDGRPRAIVQVVVTPPRSAAGLRLDGRSYELTSLYWHTPAEHTIDGRRPPMELHLVHAGPDGRILVVAVLYRDGAHSPALALAPVFDRLAAVRDAPAAPAQLDAHRALVDTPLDLDRPNPPGNARPLQPRGGREILTDR